MTTPEFLTDSLSLGYLVVFVWSGLMLTAQSILLYKVLPLIRKMYENSEVATKIFKKPEEDSDDKKG